MVKDTKQRIVHAAAALFMERGYSASGLKQIAATSGAPIGSLYHFFPGGKSELAAETLRVAGRAYQDLVLAVFDAAPDAVAGVRDCFEGAAAVLVASDYADACPVATVALEVASSDEVLREVTDEIFQSWIGAACDRLIAAGANSDRSRELATLWIGALEGGFLLCRASKSTYPMQAIGRAIEELVAAELGGPVE